MINVILSAIEALRVFCLSKMDVALWPNGPTGHDYWMGLSRRNADGTGRGSYVDQITMPQDIAVLASAMTDIAEFTPLKGAMPNCQYFRGTLPLGYSAVVGAISLDEALDLGLDVHVSNGVHGLELSAKSPVVIGAATVVFIIEDGMLSTWHPGPVFAPVPKEGISLLAAGWDGDWAVKLVS